MTRTLADIHSDMARLKAEKKALAPKKAAPKIQRGFRPSGKGQRQPRIKDKGFLAYVRRQPCEARALGGCAGPIQAAHIRYRDARYPNSAGGQAKNHDRHCNPLCAEHHRIQGDVLGERPFWALVGVDPYEAAARHYAAYCGGAE
ncbi:hypothetical protein [Brevundimonas balnearis]|uniref:Uncharacterized protein n=1 Tax=Brevundimonas balnearis TaxID=1572858 RepID=A0ABV6R0V2_9CAUL